jgi:hypothetical protein
MAALERSLVEYCKNLETAAEQPFDTKAVPRISREQEAAETLRKCYIIINKNLHVIINDYLLTGYRHENG